MAMATTLRNRLGTAETEPVRRSAAVAAAVTFTLAFCAALAGALTALDVALEPVTPLQVVIAVLGSIATAGGLTVPGLLAAEKARERAWSPASVSELIDAEVVIAEVMSGDELAT